MKISIVSKTFRIHDNPFLDSDVYIILVDKHDYGPRQLNFLHNILVLHLKDLKKYSINPIIVNSISKVRKFIRSCKDAKIYTDYIYRGIPIFDDIILIPTWTLVDWSGKENMLRKWFLPEALKNHNVFKEYTHKNIRSKFKMRKCTPTRINMNNIKITQYKIPTLRKIPCKLPARDLDKWAQLQVKTKKHMNSKNWTKPNTSASVKLSDIDDKIPLIYQGSKLSPYIALGIISPLYIYLFFNREKITGSSRDQLLFREMFHAVGNLREFWKDDFGKAYKWKTCNRTEFLRYVKGNTPHEDVNFAMRLLKKEGWIHHLARHLVADYLCRGGMNYSWVHGQNWFKYTLIDHDDCVNRGNWMWLSGTAFSSKQRAFYHYNPDNFIKNLDKRLL